MGQKSDKLLLFEGFIDFLSFFTVKNLLSFKGLGCDVIVLNSLVNMDKTIKKIISDNLYKEIHLYFDNDESGNRAKEEFKLRIDNIKVLDKSSLYSNCKDLNEYIQQGN